jgi:hypothetical protein
MSRKTKAAGKDLFSKTKHAFSDLGTKISGKGHKTIDEEFSVVNEKFIETKKKIDLIGGDVVSFLSAIEALLHSQEKSANHLKDLFPDGSNTRSNLLCTQQLSILDKMKSEKKQLDTKIDQDFQAPVHNYLSQFREVEDRIKERTRRCEKMDRLIDKHEHYKGKGDVRVDATALKLKYSTEAYEDLNKELIRDIPILVDNSDIFFSPLMHNLIFIQGQFWNLMDSSVVNLCREAGINSSLPLKIDYVITPRDVSSSTRTYSAMNNPYQNQTSQQNPFNTPSNTPVSNVPTTSNPQQQNPYVQSNTPVNTIPPTQQRPGPPLPGRGPALIRANGLWDFKAESPTELSFAKGDTLTIIEKLGDWWKAELNGKQGLVPANYVQQI